jgi:hypothetical protein
MRKLLKLSLLLTALIGVPTFLNLFHRGGTTPGCGSWAGGSSGASPQIVHSPTLSTETILAAFAARGSPAPLQTQALADAILSTSQQSGIDDAFALAVWASETQDGRLAIQGTNNIGNITTPDPAAGVQIRPTISIRRFPTWQAGINAWFDEIARLYVRGGHASDLTTFALYYVAGLIFQEANAAQIQAIAGYVHNLASIISDLQGQEARRHQSSGSTSGAPGAPQSVRLSDLIPFGVSRGWASPAALQVASTIQINSACASFNVGGAASGGTSSTAASFAPLAVTAMQLAVHLTSDAAGFFDRWDRGAPAGVLSQQGITWCTDFVASAISIVSGHPWSGYPDAQSWLTWTHPGLVAVAPARGNWPLVGDVIVLNTADQGHVAIIVGVQPPSTTQAGQVLVAQAHATHVLELWALLPDGTVKPPWSEWTATLGYLRLPLSRSGAAGRVVALLQWDAGAGYDSSAQHDQYWDAACSAAVFTELSRASGRTARLGQVIDQLVGAGYLSASGGLHNDAAAWPWIAEQYQLRAVVQWNRALSFDALLQLAAGQGVPVIDAVRDPAGRYYPAFAGGHFLVVVGGDKSGLRIVDSSLYRITWLPRSEFEFLWSGETVLFSAN